MAQYVKFPATSVQSPKLEEKAPEEDVNPHIVALLEEYTQVTVAGSFGNEYVWIKEEDVKGKYL